jgi:hypothetical protein
MKRENGTPAYNPARDSRKTWKEVAGPTWECWSSIELWSAALAAGRIFQEFTDQRAGSVRMLAVPCRFPCIFWIEVANQSSSDRSSRNGLYGTFGCINPP